MLGGGGIVEAVRFGRTASGNLSREWDSNPRPFRYE